MPFGFYVFDPAVVEPPKVGRPQRDRRKQAAARRLAKRARR